MRHVVKRERPDRLLLVAGCVLAAFGVVLLLDRTGTIELSFGSMAPMAFARRGGHPARHGPDPARMSDMAVTPTSGAASLRDLRRDPENGMVAGVCEGLGKRLDIDPLLLRIVFGATTLASGLGLVAYVLAWMLVPAEGDGAAGDRHRRRSCARRATGAPRSRSRSASAASWWRCC